MIKQVITLIAIQGSFFSCKHASNAKALDSKNDSAPLTQYAQKLCEEGSTASKSTEDNRRAYESCVNLMKDDNFFGRTSYRIALEICTKDATIYKAGETSNLSNGLRLRGYSDSINCFEAASKWHNSKTMSSMLKACKGTLGPLTNRSKQSISDCYVASFVSIEANSSEGPESYFDSPKVKPWLQTIRTGSGNDVDSPVLCTSENSLSKQAPTYCISR